MKEIEVEKKPVHISIPRIDHESLTGSSSDVFVSSRDTLFTSIKTGRSFGDYLTVENLLVNK